MSEQIRIQYADRETGWATLLGPNDLGVARVENIPVFGHLNAGDLVLLEDGDDPRKVMGVLDREYPGKCIVRYPTREAFHQLCLIFKLLDCKVEAMDEGLLGVAHQREIDPAALAAAAGFPQEVRQEASDAGR